MVIETHTATDSTEDYSQADLKLERAVVKISLRKSERTMIPAFLSWKEPKNFLYQINDLVRKRKNSQDKNFLDSPLSIIATEV